MTVTPPPTPTPTPTPRWLRRLALALGLVALTIYPLSALVLAGPKTPITFAVYAPVASYMHPHFPQNWNLFAPDPVNEERGVLARFGCSGGGQTEWTNITQRGVDKVQATRFFASRESRIVSNSIIMRFREDDIVARAKERDQTADQDGAPAALPKALDPLEKAVEDDRDGVERVLARYAAARSSDVCDGGPPQQVRLRYVFHSFPGWSSRNDLTTTGPVSLLDSEWIRL